MIRGMRWFLIGLVILLILAEGVLQLLARRFNPYGSYASFFESAKAKVLQANPQKTIFFVGDSTVFGGGASDEKLFSLPAQFAGLVKRAGSSYQVINLGYPGTTGKEHLEVLRLLPYGSKVVMRTGINDSWKRHESYKLHIFGQYVEFRLLKLLMIAWYGWSRDHQSESATSGYFQELQSHAKQQNLELYFVDYFLGEKTFMNTYFKDAENFIPLAHILIDKGFGTKEGLISRRFLSYDLVHANDLGYKLQAQAVFNWFSWRGKLNLKKEDQFQLAVDEASLKELRETLNSWLLKIREEKEGSAERFPFVMKAAWQVYAATGDEKIKDLYDRLSKLYIFAFHSIYPITYALNREDRIIESELTDIENVSHKQINSWFQIIRILVHRSTHDYVEEYREKFQGIVEMERNYSDYSFLDPPFPLELCELFMKETGMKKEDVSVLGLWREFFGVEYQMDEMGEKNLEGCSLVHN